MTPGTAVALAPLLPVCRTTGDCIRQLRHDFSEGGSERVVTTFREHIRAKSDKMKMNLEGRASVLQTHRENICFVNLPGAAQGQALFINAGVQSGQRRHIHVQHM